MKIQLYSIEELSAKGWKYSESNQKIYIGNLKWPTMVFSAGLSHLLGKTFEYDGHHESRYNRANVHAEVTDATGSYSVPMFLVKTKLPKIKLRKFSLPSKSSAAYFNGTTFEFPCSFSSLRKKDAVRLAEWVLKVAKS